MNPGHGAGFDLNRVPADPAFYGHCECGCGTSLHDRSHLVLRRRLAWRALNVEHARRIAVRLNAHPFEAVR